MKGCSTFVAVLLFVTAQTLLAVACWGQRQTANSAPTQLQQGTQPQQSSSSSAAGTVAVNGASTPVASATAAQADSLPVGVTLTAEFSGTVNAKKLKVGDTVKAALAQDLVSGGKLVAKSGSRLVGHVTEVQVRSDENPESRLSMVFDKIELKHHREMSFQAIVEALAPPAPRRSLVDEPDQMMPPPVAAVGGVSSGSGRSAGATSTRTTSTATNLSNAAALGQVAVVGSNPGSLPGNARGISTRPRSSGATPISGGTGMHGVYGLKDLTLQNSKSNTNSAPVIVSTKSNVKLENGTQVVLLIVN